MNSVKPRVSEYPVKPLLFQSDFDGTLTEEDVSFLILDEFAIGDWRGIFSDYQVGNISVGDFNNRAFALVQKDQDFIKRFIIEKAKLRPGLKELVEYCYSARVNFNIVSNGLDFYINVLMEYYGIKNVSVFAARTIFTPSGIDARYFSPQGQELARDFKVSYTRQYLHEGFNVIYAGNGPSDIPPAGLSSHTFTTGSLSDYYESQGLKHRPFTNLGDILHGLKEIIGGV